MYSLKSVLFCLYISITIVNNKNALSQSIGFPESEEDESLANKDNRKPMYIPALCPVGELFYPGDQKDDWICDCRPAYLYHPKTDTCWPAYRRGPCNDGFYLVLGPNSAVPICEKNPCNLNYVMYKGKCEMLGTLAPCKSSWPIAEVLTVNSTTLTVSCEKIYVESRFPDQTPNTVQINRCPAGGKRSIHGKCPATS